MAGWIHSPLGTEVDLGPGDIVLHGDPAPSQNMKYVSVPFNYSKHSHVVLYRKMLALTSSIFVDGWACDKLESSRSMFSLMQEALRSP